MLQEERFTVDKVNYYSLQIATEAVKKKTLIVVWFTKIALVIYLLGHTCFII